jgi:hypothetical protein
MKRIISALLFWFVCTASAAAQQVVTRTEVDSHGTTWTTTTISKVEVVKSLDQIIEEVMIGHPRFGPFIVVNDKNVVISGETNSRTPADFKAMLEEYPGIRTIEMANCAGTADDAANLELGRLIRARGLTTEVPSGGSVRSGGIELFLAGTTRRAAPDAEFGVHAWKDDDGKRPGDFAADAGPNKIYLDYYREMGLTPENANALYALTNSVPNEEMLWLHTPDLSRFIPLD